MLTLWVVKLRPSCSCTSLAQTAASTEWSRSHRIGPTLNTGRLSPSSEGDFSGTGGASSGLGGPIFDLAISSPLAVVIAHALREPGQRIPAQLRALVPRCLVPALTFLAGKDVPLPGPAPLLAGHAYRQCLP